MAPGVNLSIFVSAECNLSFIMEKSNNSEIVISHDWIEKFGGAEKVLFQFLNAFPGAQLVTLWQEKESLAEFPRATELIPRPNALRRRKALVMPLMPLVWRRYPVQESTDLIICSSHLFAHFIRNVSRKGRVIPKYIYVHTPARYMWVPELDRRGNSLPARLASYYLKKLDRRIARESTSIAANSEYIRTRILDCWGLESVVVYPPVQTAFFKQFSKLKPNQLAEAIGIEPGFVLAASRFVNYKQLDLVIRAAAIADKRLVVAGQGPEEKRLRQLAKDLGVDIHFVIAPEKEKLGALYAAASVFVFPSVEDFGIMPVEAMAAGTPVIVNEEGGASESVVVGKTGLTFQNGSLDSLVAALSTSHPFTKSDCIDQAESFGEQRFRDEIVQWIKP
jgi:glycosyltransferase involved in cell wall biosynthesis